MFMYSLFYVVVYYDRLIVDFKIHLELNMKYFEVQLDNYNNIDEQLTKELSLIELQRILSNKI